MKTVAAHAQGNKQLAVGTDLLVSPGSKQVHADAGRARGWSSRILDGGARVLLECTCGPCIGMGGFAT